MTDKHTINALCGALTDLIELATRRADPYDARDITAVANAETALARAQGKVSPTGDSIDAVVRQYLGDQHE